MSASDTGMATEVLDFFVVIVVLVFAVEDRTVCACRRYDQFVRSSAGSCQRDAARCHASRRSMHCTLGLCDDEVVAITLDIIFYRHGNINNQTKVFFTQKNTQRRIVSVAWPLSLGGSHSLALSPVFCFFLVPACCLATMSKKPVTKVAFNWGKQGSDNLYELTGNTARFKEGSDKYYRPVLGDLELKPNTGRFFWEMLINGENMRIGVCTAEADLTAEFGSSAGMACVNLHMGGACLSDGQEKKKLWRMVVPVSGARFGFVFDTDNGTMQLFMNTEFIGTAFNESFGLKGKSVWPAVGIAGIELHNRNIGVGQKNAIIIDAPEVYPSVRAVS